jgi:hypothetical protein
MKKYIFTTGIISANLMLFGALFKVNHFPGAGILLILSILTLCFLFLPFALYNVYQNSSPRRYKLLYIVTYLVFAFVFIGALFKIMHWPGAGWFMIIGIPLPLIVFLPVYLILTRKDKKYSMVNFMGIIFGLTFLTVFSALLAVNAGADILNNIEDQFKGNEMFIETLSIDSENTPTSIHQKSDELCLFIGELKSKLLTMSGNSTEDLSIADILNQDDTKLAHQLFFSDEDALHSLKSKITDFKQALSSSDLASKELVKLSNEILDVDDKNVEDEQSLKATWEAYYFGNSRLIIALNVLSRIERNVRFIEGELTKYQEE